MRVACACLSALRDDLLLARHKDPSAEKARGVTKPADGDNLAFEAVQSLDWLHRILSNFCAKYLNRLEDDLAPVRHEDIDLRRVAHDADHAHLLLVLNVLRKIGGAACPHEGSSRRCRLRLCLL